MEGNLSEGGKEQAVLEFMDIVGETAERARQYLQVLNFASLRIGLWFWFCWPLVLAEVNWLIEAVVSFHNPLYIFTPLTSSLETRINAWIGLDWIGAYSVPANLPWRSVNLFTLRIISETIWKSAPCLLFCDQHKGVTSLTKEKLGQASIWLPFNLCQITLFCHITSNLLRSDNLLDHFFIFFNFLCTCIPDGSFQQGTTEMWFSAWAIRSLSVAMDLLSKIQFFLQGEAPITSNSVENWNQLWRDPCSKNPMSHWVISAQHCCC